MKRVIYFLWDGSEIVYIGMTGDIKQRLKGHGLKKYDRYTFFNTTYFPGMLQEKQLIEMFNPKYNMKKYTKYKEPEVI